MKTSLRMLAVLALFAGSTTLTRAATYVTAIGTTATTIWDTSGAWANGDGSTTTAFPNAVGDVAIFNDAAVLPGAPAQTGNRTYNLNTSTNPSPNSFTVGELDFQLHEFTAASQRDIINNGSGGSLIMDADGAGALHAKIVVTSSTTTLNIAQIQGTLTLNDDLDLTIPKFGRTDFIGALRMTSAAKMTGTGGVTRDGPQGSLWSLEPTSGGPNNISYTGPTVLKGGRTRINVLGQPYQSSSFTIQGGAELEPAEDNGTYNLGNGVLHLNSDNTSDSASGVIRPTRFTTGGNHPGKIIIANSSVSLEGALSLVHSEGFSDNGTNPSLGGVQFTGVISGGSSAKLQLTTTSHSANTGTYALSGANTFTGDIDLWGGRLSTDSWTEINDGGVFDSTATTSHPNAHFSAGNINIHETPTNIASAIARMTIPRGVLNAISDTATLTIDGLNNGGGIDAIAELGQDVVERVGVLRLGTTDGANTTTYTTQLNGVTYGSTSSTAMFTNDNYFVGTGVIQTGLLGDYDGNNAVDAGDYVVWRKSYSGNTTMYDMWRANYGNTFPGSGSSGGGLSAASVPEPSTLALVALIVAPLWTNRRRRFVSRQA